MESVTAYTNSIGFELQVGTIFAVSAHVAMAACPKSPKPKKIKAVPETCTILLAWLELV
jgi:hypothetical protein